MEVVFQLRDFMKVLSISLRLAIRIVSRALYQQLIAKHACQRWFYQEQILVCYVHQFMLAVLNVVQQSALYAIQCMV